MLRLGTHIWNVSQLSWHVHNKQVEYLTGYQQDEQEDEQEDEDKVEAEEKAEEQEERGEAANEFPAKVLEKTHFLIVLKSSCPASRISFKQRN